MFGIFPKGELVSIDGELIQPALIIINEFKEVCYMPVSHWNISDYKYSWLNSFEERFIKKIIQH